jgi:hypothetical protein
MSRISLILFFLFFSVTLLSQSQKVSVVTDSEGMKLKVNENDFMINGMNWDYFPIGTNYSYSLWKQPDDIIKAALDEEMGLLKNMGVNTVRMYTGVPPMWITYIYENFGIYTMLNHPFGRYGLTIDGVWIAQTEYANPDTRKLLLKETKELADMYKNTSGLLMYLLGNENNYGLFWEGAETEDIPMENRKSNMRAKSMYKLFNEATIGMKAIDQNHPVALCNGDLLFMEIIAQECPDIDIFGTNMYRGVSFGDAFERVKKEYGKPIMFTEFGSDAFNTLNNQEDQRSQAYYLVNNWKEIYENAAGLGKAQNSIGGFTFQFSDGWWKYGQTKNLDIHDNNASWSNGGYQNDYKKGENNMNEEWFGICAKGTSNDRGLYTLYPRAAYYALKEVHLLNPYTSGKTLSSIDQHFDNIELMGAVLKARGDKAIASSGGEQKIGISKLRAEFTTFNTGGSLLTTPEVADANYEGYPNKQGFDHMQSYYVGVQANPSPNMRAEVKFNVLGHVAENPIDEIFYENRGRSVEVTTQDGTTILNDPERLKVYHANYSWNNKYFDLTGFYRTGHYHWGYEGDFFGLYPEANYGPNLDIYNGEAPMGIEIKAKRALKGFKVAFGPELWWGANPAILLKYSREIGKYNLTGMYHEDIADAGKAVSSFAIPQPQTRRATLGVERDFGKFNVQLGGIWGGQPLVGRTFQNVVGDSGNYSIYEDHVKDSDTWGGKIKITYESGRFRWYAQAAAMGLVANGGGDWTKTFTGWKLKDSGSGNQTNFLSGFAYNVDKFQFAPNFLWQKPIVAPIPDDIEAPGRPRNILEDPFVVRANREAIAGEMLITYDPTPGSWFYEWDNDRAEDARFAMNLGFVYRHHPTSQDAAVGFLNNRTSFAFPGAAPAQDLWELYTRIVSKRNANFGFIANLYGGNAQANGSDDRLIYRYGADVRMIYKKMKVTTALKIDDWGPFDYHRDFNLTYPLQAMLDISTTLGKPDWFILPSTQIGIRGTWRTLDQYSPRYAPNETEDYVDEPIISPVGFENGTEWEIRTYIHFNIGK